MTKEELLGLMRDRFESRIVNGMTYQEVMRLTVDIVFETAAEAIAK
jgi:hypothetical protein